MPIDATVSARDASVYLPEGVHSPEVFAVFLDGEVWETRMPAVLDELTAAGRLPALAAVFLDSLGPDRRVQDYTPEAPFAELLVAALPTALRASFPSLREGGHVIAGQSLGGLCAVSTAVAAPDLYGAAVSQSGSFWWPSATAFEQGRNAVAQECSIRRGPLPRLVLEWGAAEWELRGDSRRLHDVLRARGAEVTAIERSGGHDVAWWERTLPEAVVRALA